MEEKGFHFEFRLLCILLSRMIEIQNEIEVYLNKFWIFADYRKVVQLIFFISLGSYAKIYLWESLVAVVANMWLVMTIWINHEIRRCSKLPDT